jgi:hypothetical protein
VEYEIFVYQSSVERESYVLGNAILSSNCFTEGTKGLLVQDKLDNFDKSCFMYPGKFKVTSQSYIREIELVPRQAYTTNVTFNAAVKLSTGQIEPAKMEVCL